MNRMKKITITAGLALALTVGLGTTAKSAWAGYLGTQNSAGAGSPNSFTATYSTTTGGSFTESYSNASSFGNTLPNPLPAVPAGVTGSINGLQAAALPNNALFYNASNLDLTYVNSMIQNYNTGPTVNGSFSGQVLSQVFKVGSGATMADAHPGELVFTYQFDVQTATAPIGNTQGVNQVSLAFLNQPNGVGAWLLGGGFNSTNGTVTGLSPIGNTLSGTSNDTFFNQLQGKIGVDPTNGTITNEYDSFNGLYGAGSVSPQIFLATNAYSYSLGNFGLQGNGINSLVTTFVPGTPEPSTLVLLGSGLGLLAFMALRRRENGLTI